MINLLMHQLSGDFLFCFQVYLLTQHEAGRDENRFFFVSCNVDFVVFQMQTRGMFNRLEICLIIS